MAKGQYRRQGINMEDKGQHWIQENTMKDKESPFETRGQNEKQWVNIGANESI